MCLMRRANGAYKDVQKLTNATQLSFAERALLQEHNRFLAKINNEAKVRRSTKSDTRDSEGDEL